MNLTPMCLLYNLKACLSMQGACFPCDNSCDGFVASLHNWLQIYVLQLTCNWSITLDILSELKFSFVGSLRFFCCLIIGSLPLIKEALTLFVFYSFWLKLACGLT